MFMTIDAQIEHFKGCRYVIEKHAISTPSGKILNSQRFRATYGGHAFLISADGREYTTNAFKAFIENRVMRFPGVPARKSSFEILSPDDQAEHFKDCVYVAEKHAILTPEGVFMKPDQFQMVYGGHVFLISADASRHTKNAFKAFTENSVVRFPKVATVSELPEASWKRAISGGQDEYEAAQGYRVSLPPGIEPDRDGSKK